MKSGLKPVLEDVNRAIGGLEAALEECLAKVEGIQKAQQAAQAAQESAQKSDLPQFELPRNEREVNKKIAARLDQTINRLEMLLSEEE